MAENVTVGTGTGATPTTGSAGLNSQVPGAAATVSNLAQATGDIAPGNLVEADIDDQLFRFQSEDTALMSLMLRSRKVTVNSPEVEHYMIDEQRSSFNTTAAVTAGNGQYFALPLAAKDQNLVREYHTLLVRGVNGYSEDGQSATPGKDLMVFVTGRDTGTGNPIVRAVNGPKATRTDIWCSTPAIPANSKVVLLANALYETQKEVAPDLIVPQPTTVYLQKRGMNQVVSDYLDAQRKHIEFSQKVIAEQAILNFKRSGNRTLWMGRKGKFMVNTPKLGDQFVYCTEGIRWQFKKELQHTGTWTYERIIALAKMFFTGEDVPKSGIMLCGKNLIEELQCIDFSKHPEVSVAPYTHPTLGWTVTRLHTYFGDLDIKREPTLDTLGLSNSGAVIGENRLVHYTYSSQHEFNDRVEGEEATRKGVVVWDGLALKGACHIWIDGEGGSANKGSTSFVIWDSASAPTGDDLVSGTVYYLLKDCPGINAAAQNGQMWVPTVAGSTTTWKEYEGEIMAN